MAESMEAFGIRVAESVRAACVEAAQEAYERARMDGVCDEGAWEVAVDIMRNLAVAPIIRSATASHP